MENELTMNTIEANLHQLVEMSREWKLYLKGAIKMKASFINEIEKKAIEVLGMAATRTMEHGHSARLDYVKDRTFVILGMAVGEDLA